MRKIKLYSIYTDEVTELKDIFVSSIKDDWDLNVEYWGKSEEGNGDFSTKGWYEIQRKKIQFLIEKIKENVGSMILWSDIDIQFFAPCTDLILDSISGKDIVFQAEHSWGDEVNVGFSVINCNEKTIHLYESVFNSEIENLPVADQSAMNNILKENKLNIKWGLLPRQFWAMSHYTSPPKDIVLHHANCTIPTTRNGMKIGSIELKLEQIDMVRNKIENFK